MIAGSRHIAIALFGVVSLLGRPTMAQVSGQMPAVFDGVGLEQHQGRAIPDTLVFFDEQGKPVALSSYFQGDKPVLLSLVYHSCEMLCSVLTNGLTATLANMEWTPGQEFEVLSISFSPADTPEMAAARKAHYVDVLGRPEAATGWHFLTGDEANILALADAIGFRYRWVEEIQQYAHPAVLTVMTPEGTIAQYIQGLSFDPKVVRMSLVEASGGSIGSPIDLVTLFCLQYDPDANSYVPHAANLMKLGGLLTVLVLGMVLLVFWRREQTRYAASAFN